ncbi:nucleotide disphospho-sugar-binding domain-containing protein [Kibdelosporangium aridum]|uniref:nucleotide disphospho-sugar-binding domain-containing protein n=1 Tax=Kibdelosporangium aridum TaxID=2030 RepID=UPI00052782E3
MRVLFTGSPAVGHLFPMVPLAWALRAAGHDVVFASLKGSEAVARAGMPLVNFLPEVDPSVNWLNEAGAKKPDLLQRVAMSRAFDRDAFIRLYAQFTDTVVDGLIEFAREWNPDLVVYEHIWSAGPVAAAALGIPAVQHDLGFTRSPALQAAMLEEMAPAFARHSVTAPSEVVTIDIAPPSMTSGPAYGWSMRPISFNGGGVLPEWLRAPASRDRVAVTLGTVYPVLTGIDSLATLIAAAADVDAEFVLALGDVSIDSLGPLPDNVWTTSWVPWNELVHTCTAVIHHGGAGTAMSSLEAAVPQLIIPGMSDNDVNARAVADRGAGLACTAEQVDTELLRTLIGDGKLKLAAAEVSAEIATMPDPVSVVSQLVDLTC